MSDLLQRGTNWLASQLQSFASQTIIYQRGGQSLNLAASPASPVSRADENASMVTRADAQDWIVTAADLVLDGSPTLPERGDRLRWAKSASETQVYEVLAADGEEHWSWLDPHQTMLRIHTKILGAE